jgi:hypothetical protein
MADQHTKYVNEDGIFEAPSVVLSLSDVPEEYRPMYAHRPDMAGKFALTAEGRELRDWAMAEVQRIKTEAADKRAKLESEIATMREERRTEAITSALTQALTRAGVRERLQPAAAALIQKTHKFEIDDPQDGGSRVVLGHSDFGLVAPDDVVGRFLESDDGAAFRNPKHVRAATGTFSAMIAGLGK